jgi:hypothetical protein
MKTITAHLRCERGPGSSEHDNEHRLPSSGIRRRTLENGITDLKESAASTFRVQKINKQPVEMNKLSDACLLLAALLVYFSTLKMEAVYSSET